MKESKDKFNPLFCVVFFLRTKERMDRVRFITPLYHKKFRIVSFEHVPFEEEQMLENVLRQFLGSECGHSPEHKITGVMEPRDIHQMSLNELQDWLRLTFPPAITHFSVVSPEKRKRRRWLSGCIVTMEDYIQFLHCRRRQYSLYRHVPSLLFPCSSWQEAHICLWSALGEIVQQKALLYDDRDGLKCFGTCMECYSHWRHICGTIKVNSSDFQSSEEEVYLPVDLSVTFQDPDPPPIEYTPIHLPEFWTVCFLSPE